MLTTVNHTFRTLSLCLHACSENEGKDVLLSVSSRIMNNGNPTSLKMGLSLLRYHWGCLEGVPAGLSQANGSPNNVTDSKALKIRHYLIERTVTSVQEQESLNSSKCTISSGRRQKTAINYARVMGATRNKSNKEVNDENPQDKVTADAKKNPRNADSWSLRCHLSARHGTYRYAGWLSDLPTPQLQTYMSSLTDQEYERNTSYYLLWVRWLKCPRESSLCCIRNWNNRPWAHLRYHTNCLLSALHRTIFFSSISFQK